MNKKREAPGTNGEHLDTCKRRKSVDSMRVNALKIPEYLTSTYPDYYLDIIRIGYRLRWRSDTWRTDRRVAEERSPGIRPATDDIRHNAP